MAKILLMLIVLTAIVSGLGFAQQPSTFTAEKIADNFYIVSGGVSNSAFIVGEKEVAVIDAQMTVEAAQRMIAEIKKVTSKPITRVILTHSDGDHVNGLAGFPKGLEIISSIQTKNEMVDAFKAPNMQGLQEFLPTKTFAEKMSLHIAPEQIELLHFGPAHTSGDIVVFLPNSRLAFVADLVFIGRDPLIHRQKGGTSTGLIRTLKELRALEADRYVTGHSGIVGKSDIDGAIRSLEEKHEKVKAMVKEGKSLEEVKNAFGIPITPAKPGGFAFPSIVEVMYQELAGK